MRLLKLAVESQRWDLVAHTIVFATASILRIGDIKPDVNKHGQKERNRKEPSKQR
jgi:hypothetical protein